MNTIQCAILVEKIKRYPWEIEQRQRIANNFSEAFLPFEPKGIIVPRVPKEQTNVWAQYTLALVKRTEFQAFLQEKGVPTTVHYPSTMPAQPAYKNNGRSLPVPLADKAAQTVVSVPMYADMSESMQNQVIDACVSFFKKI